MAAAVVVPFGTAPVGEDAEPPQPTATIPAARPTATAPAPARNPDAALILAIGAASPRPVPRTRPVHRFDACAQAKGSALPKRTANCPGSGPEAAMTSASDVVT